MKSLADRIEAAKKALDTAATNTKDASAAAEKALKNQEAALAAYDQADTARALAEAQAATLKRERACRLEVSARQAEQAAQAALASVKNEGRRALYDAAVIRANACAAKVASLVPKLVAIDRLALSVAEEIAGVVLPAEEAYAEAKEHAAALGIDADFQKGCPKISPKRMRYLCNVGVQIARDEEHRSSGATWISGEQRPDWRHADRPRFDQCIAILDAARGAQI